MLVVTTHNERYMIDGDCFYVDEDNHLIIEKDYEYNSEKVALFKNSEWLCCYSVAEQNVSDLCQNQERVNQEQNS